MLGVPDCNEMPDELVLQIGLARSALAAEMQTQSRRSMFKDQHRQ